MVCHGELFRLRPKPKSLTTYYLLIAIGGVLGGAFVSIIAPVVFTKYWESLLGVYLAYLMFGYVVVRGSDKKCPAARVRSTGIHIQPSWAGTKLLFGFPWLLGALALPGLVLFLGSTFGQFDVSNSRNFYGLLSVKDVTVDGVPRRNLVDGTTMHGYQLTEETLRRKPTSYFRENTGVALVMDSMTAKHDRLNVGIVGLGAGTLSAYGRATDRYRYYELNPAVAIVANQFFSFIEDSDAEIDVVIGDARVSMEQELQQSGSRNYDVLIIDAFISDAIPVHLLTREAFDVYWSHLNSNGVLAFHISNNYFDLSPVVAKQATLFGKQALKVKTPAEDGGSTAAEWVVVTDNQGLLRDRSFSDVAMPIETFFESQEVWTDDYSDLLGTLKK
jgi:hypothetical protein